MDHLSLSKPLSLAPGLRDRVDRMGQEFLADFLRRHTERHPQDFEPLAELAHVLTGLGRLEEGLACDRKLVHLAPENPTAHYNLACSLALMSRSEDALDALERAVELGYDDASYLLADADLGSLHAEERFRRMVRRLGGEVGDPTP